MALDCAAAGETNCSRAKAALMLRAKVFTGPLRMLCYLGATGSLLAACACPGRAKNVMTMRGQCSDEPPQWTGPAPRLSRVAPPASGTGSLVGTVAERGTHRPLTGGTVRVTSG